jgi:formylglycine-generating enzyme required for sulfatase activity
VSPPPAPKPSEFPRLKELLDVLSRANLNVTVKGLLDAIWLASQPGFNLNALTPEATQSPADPPAEHGSQQALGDQPSAKGASTGSSAGEKSGKESAAPLDPHFKPNEENKGLFSAPALDDKQSLPASPLRIPAAAALASKLPLTRSLRAHRRWFHNPQILELDEEATVEETARAGGLLVPILRPALERWYELVLVADSGASMDVWQETLKEFEEVLRTAGAFRDVRRFRLIWDHPTADSKLSGAAERALLTSADGLVAQAEGLAQTNVRRLVLIATTGAAKTWTDGRMAKLVRLWSRHCSVAILQMLPEQLWPRVGMGEPSLLLRTMEPGTPTASLEARALWWDEALADDKGNTLHRIPCAVPILPLDPRWMRKWAGMQMGDGQWVPGIVVSKRQGVPSDSRVNDPLSRDWSKAVNSFVRTATPEARLLAVYLSRGSFTLPVARLVQTVKLGDRASQTQLAEILLSGLVERTTPTNTDLPREWVEYKFYPEAANILARGLRETDKEEIAAALAQHIERYWGKPVDFHAFIYDPEGYSAIPAWAQPFAQLGRTLANVPAEPEPADDGRTTAFIAWISAGMQSLGREIAEYLEARGVRVLQCDRHPVPRSGAFVIVSATPPDSPGILTGSPRAALLRACELGLDRLAVFGQGVTPDQSGELFYDSYPSQEVLFDQIYKALGTKAQDPAPAVRGAPPVDLERLLSRDDARSDVMTLTGNSTLILYSNDAFAAMPTVRELVRMRNVRLPFPAGVQWLQPGESLPAQPGQLLVLEKFQDPVVIPSGCGCILIDPGFAAVVGLSGARVYEGRSEDYEVVRKQLIETITERMPGETGWQLEPSPHVLSVFDQLSLSPVWPDVKYRLAQASAFGGTAGTPVEREVRVRSALFDALDPALRDSVSELAALREDAPDWACSSIAFDDQIAALAGLDLIEVAGSSPRSTATARYFAERHSGWPGWNLKVLEQFGVPIPLGWYRSATLYEYLRRNLIFHLRQSRRMDLIEEAISDFRWWTLRVRNDSAAALMDELRTVTGQKQFTSFGRLLDTIPSMASLSAEEIAQGVVDVNFSIPDVLRDSAAVFLRETKSRITSQPEEYILLAGSRQQPEIDDQVRWASHAIAREIARRGFGLLCGAQPGSDQIAIKAFVAECNRLGRNPGVCLRIVTSESNLHGVALPEGAPVHYVDDQIAGSIQFADAVVLLGGASWMRQIFDAAYAARTRLFPIPGTGSAAASLFRQLVAQGTMHRDLPWARAIENTEDAAAVATALLDQIAAPALPVERVAYPISFVSAIPGVTYNDNPAERHGPFVRTRGQHSVSVPRNLRMGTHTVTNSLFLQFIEDGGYEDTRLWAGSSRSSFLSQDGVTQGPATWHSGRGFPDSEGDHPVTGVCYLEAQAFARWLDRSRPEKGWTWCIPQEDAWEISARSPQGFQYPWGNDFVSGRCNSSESGLLRTSEVGLFPLGESPFGCADMAGNVWEFVEGGGSVPPGSCVLRGGSFKNNQHEVRNCFRLVQVSITHRAPDFGIRCAQVPVDRRATNREIKKPAKKAAKKTAKKK